MLDREQAAVAEQRSSRSRPLADAEVTDLLRQVDTVVIARGRSVRRLPAAEATIADLKGPTGGYRAPIVRRGTSLLVGFHPETLASLLAE